MPALDPSSPQARERERIVLFKITSPLAAMALVYGFVSSHPPLLLLSAFGLHGMVFTAILLWGNRRKHVYLAIVVAWGFFGPVWHFIERAFYARTANPSDLPWSAFIAELAAFWLGCALAFTLSVLWKSTPDKSESNV